MSDQTLQNIEEEIPAIEVEESIAPLSIREELATALAKSKEIPDEKEEIAKEKTPKTGRERDQEGKFAKESKQEKVKQTSQASITPEIQPIAVPKSFPAANAKDWATLPRPIQEMLAKREEDFHKELTKHDEERNFGRQVQNLATPYMPLIKAEGGDLVKGFEQYLNTAYILRTKTPQEKGQLILKLAQEFGADLRGATQQAQLPHNPVLQQLQQELAGLKGKIEQEATLKKQQEESAIKSQIDAFAADPKYPHFEAVKPQMAALLRSGVAKDLQDAYDQAVYANPHTRSTLLEQNKISGDEQRVADKKAKAEAARKAGSSIKGAPGMAATKNGVITQPNLRKELEASFALHRNG